MTMIASVLFAIVAALIVFALAATLRRHGGQALALRARLNAPVPVYAYRWTVREVHVRSLARPRLAAVATVSGVAPYRVPAGQRAAA